MDSLSEENRSNDDPSEWELFRKALQSPAPSESNKKKIIKVYKAKPSSENDKDGGKFELVDEASGETKVFKMPVVIKKEVFSCEYCDKSFTIQRHLQTHCKREHDVDIEVELSVGGNGTEQKYYYCNMCKASYSRLSTLKNHQRTKHCLKFETDEKPFECNICFKTYDTGHFLKLHQADKHGKLDGDTEGVQHECKHCGLQFNTFRALRMHKRHHEKRTNHVCEICGRGFLRMDTLKAHSKYVHQGVKRPYPTDVERKFVCEICGCRFLRRSNLNEHIRIKHSNEPLMHKCSHCEKTFSRPHALEYHVNKLHLKQRPYTCDKCNKACYSKHSLYDHKTICNMAADQKIRCEACGKLFTSNHNYKLHMQAVHSTPALVCPCGTVVRWQSSVTKHRRRCSLYNNKQKMKRIPKKFREKLAEAESSQAVEDSGSVVYLQNTVEGDEIYTEMEPGTEGATTVVVSEAEADVVESVGKLLEAIPQEALGEGADESNVTVIEGQPVEGADNLSYRNVSVVTQDGQDSQKIYYVIQY